MLESGGCEVVAHEHNGTASKSCSEPAFVLNFSSAVHFDLTPSVIRLKTPPLPDFTF